MSSPKVEYSPSFKHARNKPTNSPSEIKDKLRKSYRARVQEHRGSLLNKLRFIGSESDMRCLLSNMLQEISVSHYSTNYTSEDEEGRTFKDIESELVDAELNWLLEEYEKVSLSDIDLATLENTDEVICPMCLKHALSCSGQYISCEKCSWSLPSSKTLTTLKQDLHTAVNNHGDSCHANVQFALLSDLENHLYMICDYCSDMRLIV